jgi:hypothetical protein
MSNVFFQANDNLCGWEDGGIMVKFMAQKGDPIECSIDQVEQWVVALEQCISSANSGSELSPPSQAREHVSDRCEKGGRLLEGAAPFSNPVQTANGNAPPSWHKVNGYYVDIDVYFWEIGGTIMFGCVHPVGIPPVELSLSQARVLVNGLKKCVLAASQ